MPKICTPPEIFAPPLSSNPKSALDLLIGQLCCTLSVSGVFDVLRAADRQDPMHLPDQRNKYTMQTRSSMDIDEKKLET